MSSQVKVEQGMLQGRVCKTYDGKKYHSFEGIPYAKPPVGALRYKAPQELENWSGIKEAIRPGNKCVQINLTKGTVEGSEDCLYLNIYTPSLERDKKYPVVFFIHGGRLILGYGDYYRPDYYIQRDVILVTINYRVNVFGFLCLNTEAAPGNAGLKDAVTALRWVKRNIKHFSGDDNNITVSGESAGGAIATSFLTSKMADGLFSKVICQSGNSLSDLYMIDEDVLERASKITECLGKQVTDIDELHDIFLNTAAEDLVYALAAAEMARPPAVVNALLLPVVEKEFDGVERFFEETPLVAFKGNKFAKVPVLASLHNVEGAPFLTKDEHGNVNYESNLQYYIPRCLFVDHNSVKALKFASTLHKYYFDDKKIGDDTKVGYLNLLSDHLFVRDMILFLDMYSKYQDVFLCYFGYSGNLNTRVMKGLGVKGATHGDLLQYLFYRESKVKLASEKDLKLVEMLVDSWCNFAKIGTPDLKNLEWQPYEPKKRLCLNIEEDIKVEQLPNVDRVEFWIDLMKERSKL